MAKVDNEFNEAINKIDTIKKIASDPTGLVDKLFENRGNKLSEDINKKVTNKVSDLKNSVKKIKPPQNNVFNNMITLANTFLDDPGIKVTEGNSDKEKLLKYIQISATKTIKQSKQIISDEVGLLFNGGLGSICSGNQTISSGTTYQISPKEFDLMNVLKTSPDSSGGQIMYENPTENQGKIKFNRELFNTFNNNQYTFTSVDGTSLLNIEWNSTNQNYNVNTIPSLIKMGDFFNKYYESIEYPDIDYVIKTTMLLVLQGDGSEGLEFNVGLDNIERLVKKLTSYCNILNTDSKILKNNPTDTFTDFDTDISTFFDFNDVEGINIDDEDARYRRVLKFVDCNNYEVPVNKNNIEDFLFENSLTPISLLNTFSRVANEVSDEPEIYKISLFNSFITKVPVALLSVVMSPKIFFPIIIAYKVVKNITTFDLNNDVKYFLNQLRTMVTRIIGRLFKIFILSFWNLLKVDILRWISKIAAKILTNKLERYKIIVLALIKLLTRLLEIDVNNCGDIYKLINMTIDGALNLPGKINIPNVILGLSDKLPGFSTDRAYMNVVDQMTRMGVETGTLYGESNDLLSIIKSQIDGVTKETDTNSFIKGSNPEIKIPTPFGVPIIIPPGIIPIAGKQF